MDMTYIGYGLIALALIYGIISLIPKSENKKSTKRKIKNKKSFYVPMPKTYSLQLPTPIEKMSTSQLDEIARKIFASYKTFDYKHANMASLEKKDWHTWQVSILLMLYKKSEEFLIYEQDEVFNDFFLKASPDDMKSLMRDVINKYEKNVEIFQTKDALCKDYIWSSKDVSVIFYFLATYKKYA